MSENKISHPAEPMRVGSLVRWPEYPNRLYFIRRIPVEFCGQECAEVESIDHKYVGMVGVNDLVLDDVDYDER